ncbi:nitroreductase family deazaflavin-dependent oxidoreductase [Saccharopolyspora rhizosphaerae]|uniref:Nitroreductase family deazaflavin-dependent oxidoreductase n=1 Tax=Saccharopolyspora rhizosphaerae TaxID=2492662 RepID=A0A426JWG7_9PSEU|nr:nitroreductase family deazaflavin-dependent oxidoreductase [Saccharopolyspora rhizosphaerae]RRO17524.1 nitroreductase family deazaflavin-dependent oxidoreductase [Saccharopolyspora rhizosphaerae]
MPKQRPPQLDSPKVRTVIKAASRANTRLYRLTGGLVGSTWRIGSAFPRGVPMCLLTTTGKRSGQPRTAPLLHMRDGDRVVLVASQGGLPRHPDWYHNVRTNPEVTVQVKREVRRMKARTATPEERAELWPRLVAMYADFDDYQSWTDREIPVVICEPTPT